MSRFAYLSVLVFAAMPRGVAWAAEAPQIVELFPKDGATNVDPNLREMRIAFDQDMNISGQSVCGGGPSFPKFQGQPVWKDARTLVIKVKLEPEHEYEMSLNCPASNRYFRSAAGEELAMVPWRFTTGEARKRAKIDQKKLNGRSFDELMEHLKRDYSYYERKGIDWKARAKKFRRKIVAARSTKSWVAQVAKFLSAAEDPHLWINYKGKITGTYQRKFTANVSLKGIEAEIGKLERRNSSALVAKLEGGIGYLCVPTFAREKKKEIEAIQDILAELRDSKALILDLRGNGGGDETLARAVAAWFVEGEPVYSRHRFREANAKGGFGPVQERRIVGNSGDKRFEGPVAVLMGPVNMSSCESFLLMMKQGKKVTLIGAKSAGSSGNPQPHMLENDVEVYIPSWQDVQPDGSSLEGVGIKPDIEVKAKAGDFETGDPVIRRAIKFLKKKMDE